MLTKVSPSPPSLYIVNETMHDVLEYLGYLLRCLVLQNLFTSNPFEALMLVILTASLIQSYYCHYSHYHQGICEDVSSLVVPFGKSGVKRQDVVERLRKSLVGAMKSGMVFALYLGTFVSVSMLRHSTMY